MTYQRGNRPGSLGARGSFADIGQSIAHHLGVAPLGAGKAWQAQGTS
jgi:phosphopentomutase